MSTTTNLAITLEQSDNSWYINNGQKIFSMNLSKEKRFLDVSSCIFSLVRTTTYYPDTISISLWITDSASKPSRAADVITTISTAQNKAKTFSFNITNGINNLDGSIKKVYIVMVISDSSNKCNFNSSSNKLSTITYDIINRDYNPNIYSISSERTINQDTEKFNQSIKVRVLNNSTMILNESYSSKIITKLYINGQQDTSHIVETTVQNSGSTESQNKDVDIYISDIGYKKSNSYRFTSQYIITWILDGNTDNEYSSIIDSATYSSEAVPINISKNNMGVSIGAYSTVTENDIDGKFECSYPSYFYKDISAPNIGERVFRVLKPTDYSLPSGQVKTFITYTIPKTGLYWIRWNVDYSSGAKADSSCRLLTRISINSSLSNMGGADDSRPSCSYAHAAVCIMRRLNKNDTINCQSYKSSSGTITLSSDNTMLEIIEL